MTAFATRAALALALLAPPAAAQNYAFHPAMQPELRAEVAVARRASAVAGAGFNLPLGLYGRGGVTAGLGLADTPEGTALALRADCSVRFLMDPFAQFAWGPYAGGGLTVRRDGSARARTGVLLVLGVEGRRTGRWVPAVEAALGEGARLALVLRRARTNGR